MHHNLAIKLEERYTYKDYITWNDDTYWELIDGIAYQMAPPKRKHQDISGVLHYIFYDYLKDKTCKVYHAPFGVRLPLENEPDEYVKDAVLPDIVIVCDEKKLDDAGCRGAPDFIVEILSPSTSKRDMEDKRDLYERAGVKEYWIIDPYHNNVQVYILMENKTYGKSKVYGAEDKIKVSIFQDMEVELETIFNR